MIDVDPRIAADPRIVVDPRIAADPRIVEDPRIAADPRIAVNPRIWSDVRALIYVSRISYPPAAIGVSVRRNVALAVHKIVSLRFHLSVSFVCVCFVSMGCL